MLVPADLSQTAGLSSPCADLLIHGSGTVYLIHGTSPAGQAWIDEHLPADAQRLGDAVVVEHRYIGAIVEGARADGLEVR